MQSIIMEKYRAGINLGGWISQSRLKKEHIDRFILKEDIARIASWGLDHVRLPFDYPVLENDNEPFVYLEEGFAVITKLIGWAKEYGLNVVLDMHQAPGYAFWSKDEDSSLFSNETTLKRFISLWEEMARRYKTEGDNVIFELMNEITDPHGEGWNQIARKAIEAIRAIDSERYILLGGPHYNSVDGLKTLAIWEDEKILYNFHFYEPFFFTHQRASWTPLRSTDLQQPYPGPVEGPEVLQKVWGGENPRPLPPEELLYNKEYLVRKLAPALKFMAETGKALYCGEFGAIDLADMDSRVNWLQDITSLLNEYKIGRAYWSYKGMNFSSIDREGNPVSEALVAALRQ